ncbi:MAG: CapA family protein [Bacteroidetes bacterium]|nr:CapA family protein [Bacteroidota bacterium]
MITRKFFVPNSCLFFLSIGLIFGCKVARPITEKCQEVENSNQVVKQPQVAQQEIVDLDTTTRISPDVKILRDTISIIGVGDIMMGTNFPSEDYLPANNGVDLWREVKDTLQQADITFGNFEGVILNDGGEQKECRNPAVCYLFRTPVSYASNLVNAGFDIMSLANNHAGDFGETGRKSTMRVLNSLGILYAGLLGSPPAIFEKEGLKIGFAAFAPNKGTESIHQPDRIKEIITGLDSVVDIVIASFHAGAEGAEHQHITKETETYYGENRGNVYELARTMIDAGADVVFGHGPHVTRALDIYNNRFIAYSLGNFCTYGRFSLIGPKGIAPILKIFTNRVGEFLYGSIISIKQVGRGQPIFDKNQEAKAILSQLTEEDFPENGIVIDESGRISYIEN